jgi:hypothetical protein
MEESQQVANAIYFGLGAALVIGILWWLGDTSPGYTTSRWRFYRRQIMSRYMRSDDQADYDSQALSDAYAQEERNEEIPESSAMMPKDEGNEKFQFPDAFMALAHLNHVGLLTESDALRIGIKVSPGGSARYKEARRRLTAALNELQPSQYLPLSQEQIDNRHALNLPIKK